jgi:hypothetical protein
MVETSKSDGTCAPGSSYPNNCVNVVGNYPVANCGMSEPTRSCIAYISDCASGYPGIDTATLGCK